MNVVSTGERDLATSRGGAFSRVVQLNAPLLGDDDGGTVDMLFALASTNHGWPLRWLVDTRYAPSELDLDIPMFESPIAQRHARSLAAAKLVFDRLARGLWKATGEEPPTLDLVAATADLVEVSESEGSDADRLFEALWTDFMSRPADYGRGFGTEFATVVGRDFGHEWFVTTGRAQEVAKRAAVPDLRPAMRALVTQARVMKGSKGNRSRKPLRQGEPVVDGYLLVKPADASLEQALAADSGAHSIELPVTA